MIVDKDGEVRADGDVVATTAADVEATGTEVTAGEATGTEASGTESTGTEGDPPQDPRQGGTGSVSRAVRRRIVPIVLGVALIAAAAVAGWLYFSQYRPDQQTDTASAETVVKAASDGTVALLSYAPETLDNDFAAAKSHLTGDFLSYYSDFTTKVVTPAAQQKSVKTTASVADAAVSELKPDSAVVLLFINQTTTSQENPDGAFAASTVKVGLAKIGGAWLISSFDPV